MRPYGYITVVGNFVCFLASLTQGYAPLMNKGWREKAGKVPGDSTPTEEVVKDHSFALFSDRITRRRFLDIGLAGTAILAVPGSILGNGIGDLKETRVRLRQLGVTPGTMPPGPFNAITDVAGVEVGYTTLIRGKGKLIVGEGPVRTGVTAILPVGKDLEVDLFAGDLTLNGNGEMTGIGYIRRTGRLGGPILLTNTSNIGKVYDSALSWMLERRPGLIGVRRLARAGGRGNLGCLPERYRGTACPEGTRSICHRNRNLRANRRRMCRWRYRHDFLRVQRRNGDLLAAFRNFERASIHRRGSRPGQPR